jgi:hypothetical protein
VQVAVDGALQYDATIVHLRQLPPVTASAIIIYWKQIEFLQYKPEYNRPFACGCFQRPMQAPSSAIENSE